MNIYEKLAAITSELNAVAKNLMVGEGRSSYKAVSEADVLAAVKTSGAEVQGVQLSSVQKGDRQRYYYH